MAKAHTVYRIVIGEETKVITSPSRAMAIRAAVAPLIKDVKPLTAIELAGEFANGTQILNAQDILKDDGDDNEPE